MFVLGNFALVALVLAAVGVYGVIAYFVAERSREIGIRLALGAQRADVVRLVTRTVLLSAGTGIVIGIVVAATASRLMSRLLYEVQPTDVATYASSALALLLVAALGALVPAVRAARLSPAVALQPD